MTTGLFTTSTAKLQRSVGQTVPPTHYVRVPQRLIATAFYHPLQVGVYSLVARLFLVAQTPVPLSAADITRYDPVLSRGAAQRALTSLVDGGWLIAAERAGQKTTYVPAWGRINGAPLPWRIGALCLDRPRHVRAVCLDLRLLDLFLGKLTPHPKRAAIITRYVTLPLLALADVGSYALLLGGLPAATSSLMAWGLVQDEQALPLPEDDVILARASQRRLFDENNATLTACGLQKARLVGPRTSPDSAQPLFFVPPDLIADWPIQAPANVIDQKEHIEATFEALQSHKTEPMLPPAGITWESMGTPSTQGEFPPTPPDGRGGGKLSVDSERMAGRNVQHRTEATTPKATRPTMVLLNTEAAQALAAINVLPDQIVELADTPITVVNDAIRDGKARPYVRDLAAWVVTLIRARRDHGWKIIPPPPRPDSPEALREAFACYAAEQKAQCHEEMEDDRAASPSPMPAMLKLPGTSTRLWNEIQARLKLQLNRQGFNAWIQPAVLHSVEEGRAIIVVPNVLVKEAIEERYLGLLCDLLSQHIGEAVTVHLILNGAQDAHAVVPTPRNQAHTVICAEKMQQTLEPDPNCRPDWISLEQWETLPAMLRAALIGSTVCDGTVRAVSAHLTRLLQTRYASLVEALIADTHL